MNPLEKEFLELMNAVTEHMLLVGISPTLEAIVSRTPIQSVHVAYSEAGKGHIQFSDAQWKEAIGGLDGILTSLPLAPVYQFPVDTSHLPRADK
jgi:hypothetical protein